MNTVYSGILALFIVCGTPGILPANEFLLVGDFEYSIAGKPAIPIMFGPSSEQYYDVAIAKEAVVDGAMVSNPYISMSFTKDARVYVCPKEHRDCVSVQIEMDANSVEFFFDFRLVNTDTGEVLAGHEQVIVDGENYGRLGLE